MQQLTVEKIHSQYRLVNWATERQMFFELKDKETMLEIIAFWFEIKSKKED